VNPKGIIEIERLSDDRGQLFYIYQAPKCTGGHEYKILSLFDCDPKVYKYK